MLKSLLLQSPIAAGIRPQVDLTVKESAAAADTGRRIPDRWTADPRQLYPSGEVFIVNANFWLFFRSRFHYNHLG